MCVCVCVCVCVCMYIYIYIYKIGEVDASRTWCKLLHLCPSLSNLLSVLFIVSLFSNIIVLNFSFNFSILELSF